MSQTNTAFIWTNSFPIRLFHYLDPDSSFPSSPGSELFSSHFNRYASICSRNGAASVLEDSPENVGIDFVFPLPFLSRLEEDKSYSQSFTYPGKFVIDTLLGKSVHGLQKVMHINTHKHSTVCKVNLLCHL